MLISKWTAAWFRYEVATLSSYRSAKLNEARSLEMTSWVRLDSPKKAQTPYRALLNRFLLLRAYG